MLFVKILKKYPKEIIAGTLAGLALAKFLNQTEEVPDVDHPSEMSEDEEEL